MDYFQDQASMLRRIVEQSERRASAHSRFNDDEPVKHQPCRDELAMMRAEEREDERYEPDFDG